MALATVAALLVARPPAAQAQDWPDRPVTLLDGHVTLGGQAILTVAPDDEGYFNFTDYDHSALRLARLGLVISARANDHLSFMAELRAEGDSADGDWQGSPYAAYVRLRPWLSKSFELQAGRIPTAFGGFTRRSYGTDNLLIGYPLAYQYLTSLRANAIPVTAGDLVRMRGRGWLASYPVGEPEWEQGVPLVNVFRYDAGVLARTGVLGGRGEALVSLTTGTLSNPRDDNDAPQLAGRLVVRPAVGLAAGVSVASGRFIDERLRDSLPPGAASSSSRQQAFGADVEYSRDYWLVRSELVLSGWTVPALAAPAVHDPLRATAWLIESRYKLLPGLYAAARYDRLDFGPVSQAPADVTWDADVWRVEAGVGYSPWRQVTLKGSVQHNRRDGGRVRRSTLAAAQVVAWF